MTLINVSAVDESLKKRESPFPKLMSSRSRAVRALLSFEFPLNFDDSSKNDLVRLKELVNHLRIDIKKQCSASQAIEIQSVWVLHKDKEIQIFILTNTNPASRVHSFRNFFKQAFESFEPSEPSDWVGTCALLEVERLEYLPSKPDVQELIKALRSVLEEQFVAVYVDDNYFEEAGVLILLNDPQRKLLVQLKNSLVFEPSGRRLSKFERRYFKYLGETPADFQEAINSPSESREKDTSLGESITNPSLTSPAASVPDLFSQSLEVMRILSMIFETTNQIFLCKGAGFILHVHPLGSTEPPLPLDFEIDQRPKKMKGPNEYMPFNLIQFRFDLIKGPIEKALAMVPVLMGTPCECPAQTYVVWTIIQEFELRIKKEAQTDEETSEWSSIVTPLVDKYRYRYQNSYLKALQKQDEIQDNNLPQPRRL